jgi:preprotein translocase subunit SecG
MIYFITVFHVLVCLALVGAVLMQAGKGAGLAGVFGSSGTQQMFGGRGAASFLAKATTVLAIVFMLTSVTLFILSAQQGAVGTVTTPETPADQNNAPAAPEEPSTPQPAEPISGQ